MLIIPDFDAEHLKKEREMLDKLVQELKDQSAK